MITLQLSENSENDTFQGRSKGGGREPDGGQCPMRWQGPLGLIKISLFRSAGAASVYSFVNTSGRPGPLPPSSPWAFPSVSNGNGWVVREYLVLCLFTALITAAIATPTNPLAASAPPSPVVSSVQFSLVTQSCPTLQPHESQHARPPCPLRINKYLFVSLSMLLYVDY